jgi:hypothetical protein
MYIRLFKICNNILLKIIFLEIFKIMKRNQHVRIFVFKLQIYSFSSEPFSNIKINISIDQMHKITDTSIFWLF